MKPVLMKELMLYILTIEAIVLFSGLVLETLRNQTSRVVVSITKDVVEGITILIGLNHSYRRS